MELARREGWTAPGDDAVATSPDAAGASLDGIAVGEQGSVDTPVNEPDERPGGQDAQEQAKEDD
ncbi:MAG TPA: NADH-quinone oxidoreductase subunit E, partial [Janibacter terrae]|nr:NADH-quinone oxidoreductase subunit E [Janibacter terrae]